MTGRGSVTGLDISSTMVEIATENARQAAVGVDFRRGDASNMPFDENSFDLIICQAAFKNFSRPRGALDEMHRVLRAGGTAVVQDSKPQVAAWDPWAQGSLDDQQTHHSAADGAFASRAVARSVVPMRVPTG